MPINIDPETGETSDLVYGLDSTAQGGGAESIITSASNILTKGVPLTALSVLNSFANTGIHIANAFGADITPIDPSQQAEDLLGSDYKNYYDDHSTAIEFAGFAAGSFIPGLAAIKALKTVQKLGETNLLIGRSIGFFSGQRDAIVRQVAEEIADKGAIFPGLRAMKYKAIAMGAGDQVVQALAWEIATTATMKASPILDDMDFKDTMLNIGTGALFGGFIGGAIEGFSISKELRGIYTRISSETSGQENVTNFGGASPMVLGGDRAAAAGAALDAIPTATSALGKARNDTATTLAVDNAKKALQDIGPIDDPEVGNALVDSIVRAKDVVGSYGDAALNILTRLGKISRFTGNEVTDSTGSLPTGESFFINRFYKPNIYKPTMQDLVSADAHPNADLTRQWRMVSAGDTPNIASHLDTLVDPISGLSYPKYKDYREAFNAGEDVFINKTNSVSINSASERMVMVPREGESFILTKEQEIGYRTTGKSPEAPPGQKPYSPVTSAPLSFNVITGDMGTASSVVPTVGDIGNLSLIKDGLVVNNKLFAQDLTTPITADTDPLSANARYVWAGKRGLVSGDSILSNDIAMLEQVRAAQVRFTTSYKPTLNRNPSRPNGWITSDQAFTDSLNNRNIRIRSGDDSDSLDITSRAGTLDQHIMNEKLNLLTEAISNNSELSSTELSRIINAPEDFIATQGKVKSFENATIPWEQSAAINHVKLEYNLENFTRMPDGLIARGMQDLQYRVGLIKDAALTATAKYVGGDISPWQITANATDIIPERSGASLFGASNGDYGSIVQQFERLGRTIATFARTRLSAITDKLYSPLQALRTDSEAMQELNNFTFVRRSTAENYQFIPPDLATKYKISPDTAVLSGSLVKDKLGNIIEWNSGYTPKGFFPFAAMNDQAGQVEHTALHVIYPLSPKVATYERVAMEINNERIGHRNNFSIANGLQPNQSPDILYAPPIDTTKYPFFAMVKATAGQAFSDDSVSVITAKSAADLDTKIALIDKDKFQIFSKDEIKRYHEIQGDYDYQRNFAQNAVNSELQKKGILNDLIPATGSEGTIRDILDYHARQETRLARDYGELANAQLFAEMRDLGSHFTNTETSRTGYVPTLLGKTAENPYDDLIKNGLAISPKENYRLWQDAQEKVEAFASSAFEAAKTGFGLAAKNVIPFEQATTMANRMGLGDIYSNAIDAVAGYENFAFRLPPQRILSKFVSIANSVISATAIRLDTFQGLINVVSTPVLMLPEAHSAIKGVQDLLSTQVPGTPFKAPSVTKLMFQAMTSFVTNDADRLPVTKMLLNVGALKTDLGDFYKLQDALTLPLGKLSEAAWVGKMNDMVDTGSRLVGNNLTEEFSRFVPGYMAYKIFSAAGQEGQQLLDNMSTFVNRVQGNYVAHQRPVAFQGPIGQALGMFQTYQFNLLQQMFRYVENGESKSLAMLAGIQSTLFGINGLPGFQMINQHLIANAPGNAAHSDFYSNLTSPGIISRNPLTKDVGDYLLYGSLSNILSTGLYSRGDINPRTLSIIPLNPLDYPAISGGIKLLSAIASIGQNISNGGSIPTSMLLGLEHNGLSRPLSGLAQIAQGFVTTGKGGIVATTRPGMDDNTMGWSELASIANFSRLLGARPLDEAVVLDAMYKQTSYQASDMTRIEALGESLKTTMYGGQAPPDIVQSFVSKYAAAGGNIQNFGKFILNATTQSNVSAANQVYNELRTPSMQRLILSMGGAVLPDYNNRGVTTPQQVPKPGTPIPGLQTPSTSGYTP